MRLSSALLYLGILCNNRCKFLQTNKFLVLSLPETFILFFGCTDNINDSIISLERQFHGFIECYAVFQAKSHLEVCEGKIGEKKNVGRTEDKRDTEVEICVG